MKQLLTIMIAGTMTALLGACASQPSATAERADRFDCDPPIDGSGWVRTNGNDVNGAWLEYAHVSGKRYVGRRISVDASPSGGIGNFFDGDAGNLVAAFNDLREIIDPDVTEMNLVELEFSDSNKNPEAILVIDVERDGDAERRGVMLRSGSGHIDMIQLGGSAREPIALRKELLNYSKVCSSVVT